MHNLQKASVFTATVLLHCRSEVLSTFGESFVYNHGNYFEKLYLWNFFTFKAHKKKNFFNF